MRPDFSSSHRQRIAVIGSGIAGHTAAWALSKTHDVTLYEKDDRFGGHAHTVDVDLGSVATPVDTGFIVFNERNYPNLINLFATLGVATHESNMSFGLSLDNGRFEYRSENRLSSLFAQKRNLLSPRFWQMIRDLVVFYKQGAGLIHRPDIERITLGELLSELGMSREFIEDHIVPMAACIWSASTRQILDFPASTFVRFFTNHGLFELESRPQWRTVTGGSRRYVQALHADMNAKTLKNSAVKSVVRQDRSVVVHVRDQEPETFDHVVLACHGDEALKLIDAPTQTERSILPAFRYSDNLVILHRDKNLMPRRKSVWSSWNYVGTRSMSPDATVPITYWMNLLQGLDPRHDIFVSLNPQRDIDPQLIEQSMHCTHPVFDSGALAAQARLSHIQGTQRLWFCGAYWGHGFHEDACVSGLNVARALGARPTWEMRPEQFALAAE
jgi:uncharacterized protein